MNHRDLLYLRTAPGKHFNEILPGIETDNIYLFGFHINITGLIN